MCVMVVVNWLLTILCLIGTWANATKRMWCFYVWIFTNMSYVIMDIGYYHNFARSILFIVQTGFCIWGIIEWKKGWTRDGNQRSSNNES
jgi:hypothetical protein